MLFMKQTFSLEYDKSLFLNQYVTGNFGDGPWLRHVSLSEKWGPLMCFRVGLRGGLKVDPDRIKFSSV